MLYIVYTFTDVPWSRAAKSLFGGRAFDEGQNNFESFFNARRKIF